MHRYISALAEVKKMATFWVLILLALTTLLLSTTSDAAERTVVVFFSGLCNSPDACKASQQATDSIGPRLAKGTTLITPNLVKGLFTNQSDINTLRESLGTNTIVFVAYSAGHQALEQTIKAMSDTDLKKVKTLIALDSPYSGFEYAVQKVRSVNPNVEVRRFTSAQFKTTHGVLPSAPGVADAISALSQPPQGGAVAYPSSNSADLPISDAFKTSEIRPPASVAKISEEAPNLLQRFAEVDNQNTYPMPLNTVFRQSYSIQDLGYSMSVLSPSVNAIQMSDTSGDPIQAPTRYIPTPARYMPSANDTIGISTFSNSGPSNFHTVPTSLSQQKSITDRLRDMLLKLSDIIAALLRGDMSKDAPSTL